jgi:Ser/Thr protein kinase RdoA (MazF antagonist)
VWRVGPWLVKRSGRGGLKDLFRRGPALRAAERARALDAIPTPQPLVALERRRGRALESGLVVSEWIAGRHLHELWDDARALAAFPPFLARMHAAGVLHGDFHPRNALWDGERWVLLDLEGVRGPLHRLFARRLVRRQWARLLHNLEHARPDCRPDVRALFERYLEEVGRAGDRERAWAAVVREAARLP